ncbi:MAG TPA: OB-fold domain-containing protein [Acidimicrobiales bacterium]|nr:OB-fold domain-containing protein [Acidimicrobiales bacterium]
MRPLPELNFSNRGFWTSGEDGVLRIDSCGACGALVHPPAPICQVCRSRNRTQTAVSGNATVIGCTVNHQQWLPAFPPPYVIANVALDEDPSVRLTTNIVDCTPEDVHIGMRVAVKLEQHEDVWLPLFVPTGEPDGENPVPAPTRRTPRAPLTTERFEHNSVISGIGRSRYGRRLMVNPLSLTMDACLAAIADAGLTVDDIDGLSTYPGAAGMGMSEGGITAVEDALRIRPTWFNGGGEIPGPAGSLMAAMLAINAGLCRHVLCFRTVWEATNAALGQVRASGVGGGRVSGINGEWRAPFGATSAANWLAMNASQYMHRYGATRELLSWIAINGRTNAGRNPHAVYRDPMTPDDYFNARMITTPFGLFDCDVPMDGSVAVVVSATDTVADLASQPIRVDAIGSQILERVSWEQDTVTHEPQVIGQCAHLWSRASLTPADVDLALIYDGFTFNAVTWIEALGFCELGGAQDWLDGGRRIALDGDVPVNPHGGQLSEGRTHGFGLIYEAVAQLRHDAGERQVSGAEVAVVTSGGGTPSGVMLLTR